MAADETGVVSCHFTLTANTAKKISLTGKLSRTIEVVHQGGTVTDPLFFTQSASEAGLTAAQKSADDTQVVVAGERLRVTAPAGSGTTRNETWVSVICNGAASVSVLAVN